MRFVETSYGVNFEPQVYRLQIPFEEVQINRTLFYAEFNSPLARESVISVETTSSNSKIPASNYFLFRIDDFGVQNIRPLHTGPHRFLIVVFLVNMRILQATVSIEIISPRKIYLFLVISNCVDSIFLTVQPTGHQWHKYCMRTSIHTTCSHEHTSYTY